MRYLLTGEETQRLSFRLLSPDDYNDWLPLFEHPDAGRFLGMGHLVSSREKCDMWFTRSMARYENGTGGMNVLVDKLSGKMVGQCGLLIQNVEGQQIMEIGYSILPAHWGKGYASEAARKCRDYAFEKGFTEKLHSIIHPENIGSMTVAEHNGMSRHRFMEDYHGMPAHLYRVTRDEWLRLK